MRAPLPRFKHCGASEKVANDLGLVGYAGTLDWSTIYKWLVVIFMAKNGDKGNFKV